MKEEINTKEFFDKRAKIYNHVSKWATNEKLNLKTDNFLRSLKGDVAIELGAGTGILINRLKNFKRKIAFDISNEMLSKIKDESIEKIVGDVHDLKLTSSYFDLVICRQLLHYCDLYIAMENIKRVMKNDGLLHVVQLVNFKKVPESWDQKWTSFRSVNNRKLFSTKELENCFDSFGLKILRSERIILNYSYSWTDFFIKHNISKDEESNFKEFFINTPKYIADTIKLRTTENFISYNRIIRLWLLRK